jgi:hypothetical protein
VCQVSAVSRGRSPGNCFPQLGPQLFVITAEAATSRSRSSQILVGWWSAQRSGYKSPLVELANTSSSVKGSTKRGVIVQARVAFPSILGGFRPLPERRFALRFKASAVAMYIRYGIPEEPARRDRTQVPLHFGVPRFSPMNPNRQATSFFLPAIYTRL